MKAYLEKREDFGTKFKAFLSSLTYKRGKRVIYYCNISFCAFSDILFESSIEWGHNNNRPCILWSFGMDYYIFEVRWAISKDFSKQNVFFSFRLHEFVFFPWTGFLFDTYIPTPPPLKKAPHHPVKGIMAHPLMNVMFKGDVSVSCSLGFSTTIITTNFITVFFCCVYGIFKTEQLKQVLKSGISYTSNHGKI